MLVFTIVAYLLLLAGLAVLIRSLLNAGRASSDARPPSFTGGTAAGSSGGSTGGVDRAK